MTSLRHRHRRLRLALAAVPVALVIGAGCAEATAPSQEEYTAAADAVCTGSGDKLAQLEDDYAAEALEAQETGESSLNVDRPERWMRARIVPEYERMSANLRSIPAPDGDVAYLGDLYSDLDRLIADLHSRPSRGRDIVRADEDLQRRFTSYGMEVCGTV